MNLLHLITNINPTSIVGQEVFKLLEYYFTNNIKSKSLKRKQEINLDLFNKIVNHSVIVDEIKFKFFGIGTSPWTAKGENIFTPQQKEFKFDYLWRDLDLEPEQSFGQRAFSKNMEKILTGLLKFYNKYYNRQGNQNAQLQAQQQQQQQQRSGASSNIQGPSNQQVDATPQQSILAVISQIGAVASK
ncbi:hypothetical protein FGO68_gene17158 [Halteria grandinella]|uniref:Uncharacterized protein n=1 Tax=Halteria grandinella TaxID=5974 RepID=A0A8J8SUE9_HALGN|nr:hypothetical protein FGO68_gene17158 [Halteria grandinella]